MKEPARRLAAIMFTDMVGYSTLVHRNEALGLELLTEHRAIVRASIRAHNGREIDTAGDGFVVEFTSTLDAVRCAIEIQNAFARRNLSASPERTVKLRIGIHTSDVVPSESGGKHSIYGDGVNIAARLQPLAPQGGICISATVYEQINGRLDCPVNYMGEGRLKGIDRPVRLYAIDLNHPSLVRRARRLFHYSPRLRRLTAVTLIVLMAGALVGSLAVFQPRVLGSIFSAGRGPERERVAILPFETSGLSESEDYLPDGIMSGLITSISQRGIHVLAKSTVLALQKSHHRPKKIGAELGIGRIVTGMLRKHAGGYTLNIAIVDTENEEVEWTRDYHTTSDGIAKTQGEITEDLKDRLRSRTQGQNGAPQGVPNNEAYLAYMRGQFFLGKRTAQDYSKAIGEFETATRLDRDFAAAFAALAKVNILLAWYGLKAPAEAELNAIRYATQALVLDPRNSDALIALAETKAYVDFDFAEAEQYYRRAIAANERDSTAHHWYGEFLAYSGRFKEAEKQMKLALESDPLSLAAANAYAMISYFEHDFHGTLKHLKSVYNLDGNFMLTNYWLGRTYLALGDSGSAIAALSKALELGKDDLLIKAALAHAYGIAGDKTRALALLKELEGAQQTRYVSPFNLAVVQMGLGDRKEALRLLRKAMDEHDSYAITIVRDPRFDSLRDTDEFKELIRTVNKPKQSR